MSIITEFLNDFERSAYYERLAFENFIHNYKLFNDKDKWDILITPYYADDVYDVMITKHEKGSVIKRYIIELKIREKSFDDEGYVYETKKHNSLTKIKNIDPEHNQILYINFTPNGTYVWNIDECLKEYKPIKKEMNKATMTSRDDKSNKSTYLLLPVSAKKYEYRWDIGQYNKEVEIEKQKKIKEKENLKANMCLFDFLIKKI